MHRVRYMVTTRWYALPSDELVKAAELPDLTSYSFDASWAQVYDVCGAVSRAMDAAVILSQGPRSAEEASAYVRGIGASSVLGDELAEAAAIAQERGVSAERFLKIYDTFSAMAADPSSAVDAVRLFERFGGGYGIPQRQIAEGVAQGKISYADVEKQSQGHLHSDSAAALIGQVLPLVASGKAKCTAEQLGEYLERAEEELEGLTDEECHQLGDLLIHGDLTELPEGTFIFHLCQIYDLYRTGPWAEGRFDEAQAAERTMYLLKGWSLTPYRELAEAANAFFEAGVPAELAAEVQQAGGTPQQAIAIREGTVHRGLSGGVL